MSDDALPLCACVQYYDSHHPECPARRAYEALASRLDQFCKLAYDISGQQHRDERYWCVWPDQMRKLDDLRREHRGEETARIVETPVNQRGDSGANKS